eukprot:2978665-Rhodomonas_salina.2
MMDDNHLYIRGWSNCGIFPSCIHRPSFDAKKRAFHLACCNADSEKGPVEYECGLSASEYDVHGMYEEVGFVCIPYFAKQNHVDCMAYFVL